MLRKLMGPGWLSKDNGEYSLMLIGSGEKVLTFSVARMMGTENLIGEFDKMVHSGGPYFLEHMEGHLAFIPVDAVDPILFSRISRDGDMADGGVTDQAGL